MTTLVPMTMLGVHVGAREDDADPLAEARESGADGVQIFLADPQGWKAPKPHPLADQLRSSDLDIYVHAPYVLNVATTNNRIRIPSRKLLQQHMDAAASIGAVALIVHGGHLGAGDDPEVGFANWRKAIAYTDIKVPLLIENTAGGDNAVAREADRIGRLFDAIDGAEGSELVGFCLDTCHAHAGGIALDTAVERLLSLTGRIDLVHANDSRDPFDSGADRHTNFGTGQLDHEAFVDVVRTAGAPVIAETPGGPVEHKADFDWLLSRL